MDKIQTLIVDDHKIVRDGIKSLLEGEEEISIIGEASNGKEALDVLKTLNPSLIIIDISMPEMDGIEAAFIIKRNYPHIKVLALTMIMDEYQIKRMIEAGASGYILKSASKSELIDAIEKVMSGQHYFSEEATQAILNELVNPTENAEKSGAFVQITDREKDVLRLIVNEYTNQEIADELFISVRTVDAHRRNLLQKTGAKNTAGLVKYALQNKVLS